MITKVEAEQNAVAQAEGGKTARPTRRRGAGLKFAAVLDTEVFFGNFCDRREVDGQVGLTSSPGSAVGFGTTRASPSPGQATISVTTAASASSRDVTGAAHMALCCRFVPGLPLCVEFGLVLASRLAATNVLSREARPQSNCSAASR